MRSLFTIELKIKKFIKYTLMAIMTQSEPKRVAIYIEFGLAQYKASIEMEVSGPLVNKTCRPNLKR